MLIFTDERMLLHDPGAGHCERPQRLDAVVAALKSLGSVVRWPIVQAATTEQLERVHEPAYVKHIESLRGRSARLDADTAVCPASVESALLAAGAVVGAVEAVLKGEDSCAWALVRPPGHHAERDRAMGFCLFNNVAVAAAHAIAVLGVQRVLIVDWDVHHGNGTQHIFEPRRDVLFFSTHQSPLYPGTGHASEIGTGEGRGFTVNVPLPAGMGDDEYLAVFNDVLVPAAARFQPDLVMVSAGFDAHERDPLGGMRVTTEGFGRLAAVVNGIAQRHARSRLVLALEGGYDLDALGDSVRACTEAILNDSEQPEARARE
jgi:acetoin utilization deacetylase AcuC-like enzyme